MKSTETNDQLISLAGIPGRNSGEALDRSVMIEPAVAFESKPRRAFAAELVNTLANVAG